jgi:hypothetical protein
MDGREILYPIRFIGFDGATYEVDWRDWPRVCEVDPDARPAPGSDPNNLNLTGEDCALLWQIGIGTGESTCTLPVPKLSFGTGRFADKLC